MSIDKLNNLMIDYLLEKPEENERVEFKEDYCEPEKLGEILSAVSNSANLCDKQHGYIIFGVNDKTKEILGTNYNPKKIKIGNEELEHWLVQGMTPEVNLSIFEVEKNNKKLIVFRINAAVNQPIFFKQKAYIRIGSLTQELKNFPEKERAIWQNVHNRCFEKQIAYECSDSSEILSLLDYPYFFESTKQPLPENKKLILEKLEESGMITFTDGIHSITNLGGILFAKDINKIKSLARKAPRVIIYDGLDKTKTILEQSGTRGYARAFPALVEFIKNKLPSNEIIKKALRQEKKMYPEIAIRELVANALVHQDLFETGTSPMIEIYKDRIEITNPGKPLIDVDRFIDHMPRSRNEDLASFMRQINICEERGSGIDKVISSVEIFQLPAPKFEISEKFTKVTLYAYRDLRDMEHDDKIRACYQHCVLKHVSHDPMDNTSLRKRFNIKEKNYSIASRIISETLKSELIKVKNPNNTSKKYIKYIPFWA